MLKKEWKEQGFIDEPVAEGTDLKAEIRRMCKEKDAIILAHYYTIGDIQDIADFVGDSLALARKAAETDAKVMVMCGVHFMAETCKLLSPEKTVLCPDLNAGCSLADSCKAEDLKKYKELLGEYKVPVKEMISQLSKGQALRMQLAFALSYPAKIYVFDEPVGNLDVEFRDTFYGIVRELTASEQCSVILSSHLVTELEHVADEILWIGKENEEGFVRFTGTMDDLKNRYRLLSVDDETAKAIPAEMIRGKRLRENHKDYLIYQEDGDFTKEGPGALPKELWEGLRFPDLQEIMYFVEKRDA